MGNAVFVVTPPSAPVAESAQSRYLFIRHALEGSGPFRPTVSYDPANDLYQTGDSALVMYPRESLKKFAGRNKLATYRNPLMQACARFSGYLTARPPTRDLPHALYAAMANDIDGKGNSIDVLWQQFAFAAKARGAMLLLVDMPPLMPANLGEQMRGRVAPYFTAINPEDLKDYQIGDDGKFDFVDFIAQYTQPDDSKIDAVWRFDREGWQVFITEGKPITVFDPHPLGECPVLILSESGIFPYFGPFSELADLARDLFNQYSELREIHRSQNFSLLTMQVPDGASNEQKLEAARTVGETIGTANLMVHSGATPAFIAPADGPARNYLDSIKLLTEWINEISLNVEMPDQQESGIALQMRFQMLNAALSSFASRMEDLERRAWSLSAKWLGMQAVPEVQWRRDFTLADVASEIAILQAMQAATMPAAVISEQQKRIVSIQFGGLEQAQVDTIFAAIDESTQERTTGAVDA